MTLSRSSAVVFFVSRCLGERSWLHCSASRASLVQVRAMLIEWSSLVRLKLARPTAGIPRNDACILLR